MCIQVFDGFHYSFCGTLCVRPTLNQELSNFFNELWRLDVNRWIPGIDYTISVQVQNHTLIADCSQISCFHQDIVLLDFFSRVEPVT